MVIDVLEVPLLGHARNGPHLIEWIPMFQIIVKPEIEQLLHLLLVGLEFLSSE